MVRSLSIGKLYHFSILVPLNLRASSGCATVHVADRRPSPGAWLAYRREPERSGVDSFKDVRSILDVDRLLAPAEGTRQISAVYLYVARGLFVSCRRNCAFVRLFLLRQTMRKMPLGGDLENARGFEMSLKPLGGVKPRGLAAFKQVQEKQKRQGQAGTVGAPVPMKLGCISVWAATGLMLFTIMRPAVDPVGERTATMDLQVLN